MVPRVDYTHEKDTHGNDCVVHVRVGGVVMLLL